MKNKQKSQQKCNATEAKTSNARSNFCAEHRNFLKIASLANVSIRETPKLGMLFMVNPMLAMKEMGVEVTSSMENRIKRAIKKSRLSEGNKKLFENIKKGRSKIPWVDRVTFRRNKIADEIGR